MTFSAGALLASRSTCPAHPSIARRIASSKLMFLVNADDPPEASADVVEATLDHVQIDAELRHAAGDASTNIVKPKLNERGRALRFDKLGDCMIETKLGLRKPRYWSLDALVLRAGNIRPLSFSMCGKACKTPIASEGNGNA